jgi:IS30 family transposase
MKLPHNTYTEGSHAILHPSYTSGERRATDIAGEGKEPAGISQDLNATVYFADPHSPWQRGSNEHINGVLRFFFPKGSDLRKLTQQQVDEVAHLLNSKPLKCLGWLSPLQVLRLN